MSYIPANVGDVVPDTVVDDTLDGIAARLPGWAAHESAPEVALAEEFARLIAELRVLTQAVGLDIFAYYGSSVMGLARDTAVSATIATTWTITHSNGTTIPVGAQAAWQDATGDVIFETTADTVVDAGDSVAYITMTATEPGTYANNAPAGSLILIDSLPDVLSVVATANALGGTDGETDESYVARLASSLAMPRTPVLASQFADAARDTSGVYRATAIDGWNVGANTLNNARTIGVVAIDETGGDVAGAVKTALDADLQARREANFDVQIGAPTYTAIAVVFTAVAKTGADTGATRAAAEQAVKDFLDPAKWGGGDQDPPTWTNTTVVRYLDVAAAIAKAADIQSITALTVNAGTADVTLTGRVPLPAKFTGGSPSSVSGTVT